MVSYEGSYFDGETPERHPVTVMVTPEGLVVAGTDDAEDWWLYTDIRQTMGAHSDEPAHFERGGTPAEVLVVDDSSILDAIRDIAPTHGRRFVTPGWRRRRTRLALGLGLVALATAIVAFVKGVPLLAANVAERIPVSWEEQLGKQVVEQLTAAHDVCTDSLVGASLDAMVGQLAEAAASPYEWDVRVVQADAVNAFAAPGGYLVVFSGLLERSERPEQVAGVLAHEMQHVLNRHGTEALLRRVPLRLLLGAFTGDAAAWGGALESIANVGMLRYRQRDEAEADRTGVALLRAARIDPHGLVEFFEILEDEGVKVPELLSYLSTHPDTRARIETIEGLIASGASDTPRALLPDVNWKVVRSGCASDR